MNLTPYLPLIEFATASNRERVNFNNFTLSDAEAIRQGCYWDSTEADKLREFIQTYCLQSKDPYYGQPVKLIAWQWKLIRNLLSWKRADGTLRFKFLSCWIPKKNGKSTLISCLMLYNLITVAGSLGIVLASDLNEADIVFRECANMAELHPSLNELLWVRHSKRTIEYEDCKSVIKMMSSIPTGKQGHQANYICFDELAAHKPAYARLVWDAMQGATATKPNSLKLILSTAQFAKETLGYEQYARAKNILRGELIDITVLPCIYEVAEGQDWTCWDVIRKANPSIGYTFTEEHLREELEQAKTNPHKEFEFKTLRLNMWGQSKAYINSHAWQQCYKPFKEEELYGCEAYLACDWARRYDLASYTILARKDGILYSIPRIFTPNDLATKKSIADGVPYIVWSKQHITLTDGDVIDNSFIRESIQKDLERFKVLKILYDPRGMEETRKILQEANPDIPVEEVDQGFAGMSSPTAVMERYVRDKLIAHNNNPCVNWCLSNIVLKADGYGRLIPAKAKSRGRTDAAISMLIALVGWINHEDQPEIDYTPFVL